MIKKYHNHKPQTTPRYREEEPLNHHETPGRQIKQSNQLTLPHQDDCNTRMDIKSRTTKHRAVTDSHNGSNNKQKNQQQQNHRLRTDSSLSNRGRGAGGRGGLNALYWYQIFALYSTVVEVQELVSSHRSRLTNAMYHHGETL